MNIALGAVFIFILLIPPIAFYFSYSLGNFARPETKFSILDGLLISAIVSLFIHSLGLLFVSQEIRFDLLLKLVGGELKDVEGKTSNSEWEKALRQFALYNLVILIIMIGMGRLAREFVRRKYDWGVYSDILRLRNNWWYFFEGYYLDAAGYDEKEYDYIYIDALVDTVKGSMIYSGVMVGFVCKGEELDRIYIGDAERRELRKRTLTQDGQTFEGDEPGEAFRIEGQLMCLPYSQIKNLNLRFIELQESEEEIEALADMT